MMRAPAIVKAKGKHSATVFFFHGRGDQGHGWAAVLRLKLPFGHVKYVCPHARPIKCTLAGGTEMPTWFDVRSLNLNNHDEEGMMSAAKEVHELIRAEEAAGIPSDRVVLAGFSQGGALAILAALTYGKPLAGAFVISTYLPLPGKLPKYLNAANVNIPMFQTHGDSDPLLIPKVGAESARILGENLTKHTYKTYTNLGHDANEEVLYDMKMKLTEWLPEK